MSNRKYDGNTKCVVCGNTGIRAKGMCHKCYYKSYQNKKIIVVDKYHDRKRLNKSACTTLCKHHNDLKDDPERLTTDFLQKLINVKCEDK